MAASTRSRSALPTWLLLLTTDETVKIDTPDSRATSEMLAAFFGLDFLVGIWEQRQPLRIPSLGHTIAQVVSKKSISYLQLSSAAKAVKQSQGLIAGLKACAAQKQEPMRRFPQAALRCDLRYIRIG